MAVKVGCQASRGIAEHLKAVREGAWPALWGGQWSWRRGIKGKWKELLPERLGRLCTAV